jgi:hypothetical protein
LALPQILFDPGIGAFDGTAGSGNVLPSALNTAFNPCGRGSNGRAPGQNKKKDRNNAPTYFLVHIFSVLFHHKEKA